MAEETKKLNDKFNLHYKYLNLPPFCCACMDLAAVVRIKHFISAPHVLPLSKQQNGEEDSEGVGGERNNDDDPRTWCHVEDKPHSLLHKDNFLNVFEGFNETLELIDNAVEKNGPFNGILAFSMGTCVVTIMQALQILFPENFISAPHLVPQAVNDGQEDDSANNGTEDQRTWFNFHENPNLFIDRTNFLDMYVGFDETQILLKKTIEENGLFDGIFAFSLGSCVVALLQAIQYFYPEKFKYKFRFVILISGLMKSEAVQKFLVEHAPKFRVRSLHIMGSNDNVVSNDKSRAVLDLFENAILYVHSGGHFVPTSGPNRKEFYEIFDKFIFSDDGCVQ